MGKRKIAIIGIGIGGLSLGYSITQGQQFEVTIYSDRSSDDIRGGRIPSTQVHFEALLKREKDMCVPDYGEVNNLHKIQISLDNQRLFKGNLNGKAISIDQRIYLPVLMKGLKDQGAKFVKKRISRADLGDLSKQYDLIIDCSGKRGPIADFEKIEEENMPKFPQRVCSAGFFYGLIPDEENKLGFNIVSGQGELFEMSIVTKDGIARSLLLEAVPGGALDEIKGDNGPVDFAEKMKTILKHHFPSIYERVDEKTFKLVDDHAYVRMAIKPELRIPYTMLNNTLILGCGDSVILNDPITGQGANTTSFCAEQLYQVILEHKDLPWNLDMGEQYWLKIKEYAMKVTKWTNAMMGPPSEAFSELLGRAINNQHLADDFVNLFHNPIAAHNAYFNVPVKKAL